MGGVAHEIAVQAAARLRLGQIILGQREVIHADVDIAGLGELLDRQRQQRQLLLGARQIFGLELALRLEHLRQMRIAIDRQPIRAHRDHRVECLGETGVGLFGQAINQIDVYRAHAAVAAGLDHRQRVLDALDAVDRLLHIGIEILHPEAGAVEADACQCMDVGRADRARVDFNRKIALGRGAEMELAAQGFHQLADQLGSEEVRRTTAKVQLDDIAVAVKQRRNQGDLTLQPMQVGGTTTVVMGDDAVAAAVKTGADAKRHMHIQRQPTRDRVLVAGARHFTELRLAKTGGKLRRGRVRGIARPGPVIAAQQVGVKGGNGIHGMGVWGSMGVRALIAIK